MLHHFNGVDAPFTSPLRVLRRASSLIFPARPAPSVLLNGVDAPVSSRCARPGGATKPAEHLFAEAMELKRRKEYAASTRTGHGRDRSGNKPSLSLSKAFSTLPQHICIVSLSLACSPPLPPLPTCGSLSPLSPSIRELGRARAPRGSKPPPSPLHSRAGTSARLARLHAVVPSKSRFDSIPESRTDARMHTHSHATRAM